MAICQKIRTKKRSVCIGDMIHKIEINSRSIQAPTMGGVDFGEDFQEECTISAAIETKAGETVFDSSNTERVVTHRFYVRFEPDITAETWINFDSNLYDILTVENLDQRSEFLLLRCTLRGPDTVKTNFK